MPGSRSFAKSGTYGSPAEGARRDHDVAAHERAAIGVNLVATVVPADALHARAAPHWQFESPGVRLEEIRHLVLGRIIHRGGREPHAWQRRGPRRAVETERVVVAPPVVAYPPDRVENHELPISLREVVARGQPGLPGTDDDRLDVLSSYVPFIRWPPSVLISDAEA